MQIGLKKPDTIEIKTKQSIIELSNEDQSKVNEITLSGPGEYEIGDVEVKGFASGVYVLKTEDLTLVYLDGVTQLSQEQIESLGDVDILFCPASHPDLVNLIEPKIAIPVGQEIDKFCQQENCPQPVVSVKISRKDLLQDQSKIVVLKS